MGLGHFGGGGAAARWLARQGAVVTITDLAGEDVLTAAILRADGHRTWLGGNIGESLLESLDRIGPGDWVVLELSSFQLWYLNPGTPMPDVAVVTNCTPNHLDWHGDFAAYRAAKQRILTGQREGDLAVLNPMDPEVRAWGPLVRGRQLEFFPEAAVPRLRLPGPHNRVDAACAATAARGLGCGEAFVELIRGLTRRP